MTSAPPTSSEAPTSEAPKKKRPWTLQRRLIVTVVSIVSGIMVLVAVLTSALLGQVLEGSLNSQLEAFTQRTATWIAPQLHSGQSAEEILEQQPPQPGLLLAIETPPEAPTAAVTSESGEVSALTDDQIDQLAQGLQGKGPYEVTITDVGTFRVQGFPVGQSVVIVGLSRAQINATIAQMLTTIGLLTAGGLLVLAAATTWTIRAGLAPLRAVAETASRVAEQPLAEGEVVISERVPADQADPRTEIGQVGSALNTLLDHVGTSLDARQRNEERMRRFVADASHELRTPLASIRGYSELSLRAIRQADERDAARAARADITDETTLSSLERIQAQSLRMTTLVEDLLLLARLDEGRDLVYGTVDLSRLAVESVGDQQAAGPDHRWVLETPEEPVVIAGDAGRMVQVLANLLANARTHTPAGTTVTVTVAHDGAEALLSVHDNGPGIDPAVADELFERFARADISRARQTGGTGLGLSIAQAIVQAHRGTLTVRSEPGSTRFDVRVPARPDDPQIDAAQ